MFNILTMKLWFQSRKMFRSVIRLLLRLKPFMSLTCRACWKFLIFSFYRLPTAPFTCLFYALLLVFVNFTMFDIFHYCPIISFGISSALVLPNICRSMLISTIITIWYVFEISTSHIITDFFVFVFLSQVSGINFLMLLCY